MKLSTITRLLNPGALLRNRSGTCAVCGKVTLFIVTGSPETIRNHAVCLRCGSTSRNRHVALWIRNEFQAKGIGNLGDFRAHPELIVHNTSVGGFLFKALGTAPNITHSEYYDGVERGAYKNGVLNQDLQALTFSDCSIDLMISEDVFEHVPDFRKGFAEVHRVLKPGGKHIFTIPHYNDRLTRDLFRMENGKPVLFEPIEYHGDPIRGQIPCFTHFGHDTLGILEDLGFEARLEWSRYADNIRYGTFDCYTFITKKR
jgi:SAM-dependent methyltransferase